MSGPRTIERQQRTRAEDPRSVPGDLGEADLVVIDTTWGEIQPLEAAPGVRTVGELELLDLVRSGAALVDTRVPGSRGGRTLPGAVSVPHDQLLGRKSELPSDSVAILFCNGPQCPQSPGAIRELLDAGVDAELLAYYRGGLHDWVSLGYPTEPVPAGEEDDS
jgi:rhodanese-related sulfurtransferase